MLKICVVRLSLLAKRYINFIVIIITLMIYHRDMEFLLLLIPTMSAKTEHVHENN